ncbi:MAG: hypothetical protein EOO77_07430 [Oxalobacteraceae bacterium]|nr:MAG: hypothetical protein EOO77_07430 [Oxalobacteraceae bacterium]
MTNILEPLERRKRQRTALERQLEDSKANRKNIETELLAHSRFNISDATSKLSRLHYDLSTSKKSLGQFGAQIASINDNIKKLENQASSPLMFITYLSKPQADLRKRILELKSRDAAVRLEIAKLESECKNIQNNAQEVSEDVHRFSKFDVSAANTEIEHLKISENDLVRDLRKVTAEISGILDKAGSHIDEYDRLRQEARNLSSQISKAEHLDLELSHASNGYERAKIHEQCESQFGDGSPKRIIRDAKGKLRSVNNNIPKLERRIKDAIQKSERIVSHLIIDGNNACYDSGTFIQLRAVRALVNWAKENCRVTVVFDSSIRRNLKADDSDIRRYLGSSVSVYVSPTKTAADEYILKLAGTDPHTFVLSNDRYAEFHDYDAVAAERVLRFLVADDRIMVNDLDLSIPI